MEIRTGIRLKHIVLLMAIAFGVTLAVMVVKQMSPDAMAVVLGVVCGVLAAVPTTVLLMMVLMRGDRLGNDAGQARQQGRPAAGAYPPVVVIQGGAPQAPMFPSGYGGYWPGATMGAVDTRDFRVVGGEELLQDRR